MTASREHTSAIVTGSSRGIGKAIAERLAQDDTNVALCSRDIENVRPVAEEIAAAGDCGDAIAVECDVREYSAVDDLVQKASSAFGGVDVLVNNAGGNFMASFDDISTNGWRTIIDINLNGTVNCTNAAAEHLKEGGGAVINIASNAGQLASPERSHYGAAKAAIIHFTKTLAVEWAANNVRVNCISPGFVVTPGLESQMGITADSVQRNAVDRRIGLPEEIADVAAFLVGPEASYIIGETLSVQGLPPTVQEPTID